MNNFKLVCCFCNNEIESTAIDPCDVNILSNWDKDKTKQNNQTFWCHYECFKEKLHKDIKQHLVLHLLGDKEE